MAATDEIQNCSTAPEPTGKLVRSVPPPGRDHRQHQTPALLQKHSVEVAVLLGHRWWNVGHVELEWTPTAGLEVDEPWSDRGVEDVAWMRLAVEELLSGAAPFDLSARAGVGVEQELPIGVIEARRQLLVRYQMLRVSDPIEEVRRVGLDRS